jgi:hypothetical protein
VALNLFVTVEAFYLILGVAVLASLVVAVDKRVRHPRP